MPLTRLTIKNFKSIKECDITFSGLNVLIGENGTGKTNILISTHSSRLTKNLIIECDTILLYNVKLVNRYSLVYRMKRFPQYSPTSKYRVADDHINAYFSRVNLFVEGETELELFSNPYLRILFPKLKKIDVFKAVSEKPVLNIMNPQLSNSQIPYLCLIDIDKAISFDKTRKRFVLKPEYLPEDDKERYIICHRTYRKGKNQLQVIRDNVVFKYS